MTIVTENLGIVSPMNKVYALTRRLESMSMFFTIFTLTVFRDMQYNQNQNSMMKKNETSNDIDGPPFIVGVLTIFKQFHRDNYTEYIHALSHYFKNIVFDTTRAKPAPV